MSYSQIVVLRCELMAAAAGANASGCVTVPPGKWRIKSARWTPSVAASADASHYATLTLSTNQLAASVSFVTIATALTTATVAMVLGTPRTLALLTTAAANAALEVPGDGTIQIAKTYTGNGVVVGGAAEIVLEKVPT